MSCIPALRKDLGHVFHVPLAGWCLIMQLYTLTTSVVGILQVLNSKYRWWRDDGNKGFLGPEDATMISFLLLLTFVNLCGMLGILTRWNFGLRTIDTGFRITLVAVLVTVLTTAMVFFYTICGCGGGTVTDIGRYMYGDVIILGMQIVIIGFGWHTMSGIISLQHVMACGGSGWEKLNYIDIRNMRRSEAYLDMIQ